MAINFPDTPSVGAVFTGTNGVVYTYDGTRWRVSSSVSNLIPIANNTYDLGTQAVRWRSLYVDTINVLSTAASTSSSTGALLVAGGVGIQGALHVKGQIYTQGFLLGPGSEFDPIYSSGTAATITATNISNWNTAYSWGNHAVQGYINTASFSSLTNHLIPLVDAGIDLGSPTRKWRSLYVSTNTIFIGTTSLSIIGGELSLGGVKQVATTSTLKAGTSTITLSVNNRLSVPGKISFGMTSVGAPNTSTYSGEKLVLWDNGGGYVGERHFAIGIENGHMWFATDTYNNPGNGFKWYAQEQELMKLDSSGTLLVSKIRVPFSTSSTFDIVTTKDYGFAQLEHAFKVDGDKIVLPTGAGFISAGGDIWSLDGLTNKLVFPNLSFIEYGVGTNINTGSLALNVIGSTGSVLPPTFSIQIPNANLIGLNTWTFKNTGLIHPDGTTSSGASVYVPYATSSSYKITTEIDMLGSYMPLTFEVIGDTIKLPTGNGRIQSGNFLNAWSLDSLNKSLTFPNNSDIEYGDGTYLSTGSLRVRVDFGGEFKIFLSQPNKTWTFNNNGHIVFPDGSYQTTAAQDPTIFFAATGTFTNKTINIQAGQGNVFQIQGNSISSYSGSGNIVALTSMPTFSGLNINNSSFSMDGGSGSYYWAAGSADGTGPITKAGVYRSSSTSSNSLFTFGANGSGNMSVQMDGSLFVGSTLPANNGGLNTNYGGWLVVESGGKFGGDVDTLGGINFGSTITGDIAFANNSAIQPLNGNLQILTNNTATTNYWTFGSNATLTLPNNVVLKDNALGSISLGYNAGQNNQNGPNIAIGTTAGENNQAAGAVAIGYRAGRNTQGAGAVALGINAGVINQGAYAVAIGNNAGYTNQTTGSIVINASASVLDAPQSGLYISTIRPDLATSSTAHALYYNPITKEITTSTISALINDTATLQLDSTGQITLPGTQGLIYSTGNDDLKILNNQALGSLQLAWQQGAVLPVGGPGKAANLTLLESGVILTLTTNSFTTTQDWTFNYNGSLTFPTGMVQNNAFTGTAALLDITNTNGITTVYYPTFVENRSNDQIVRADIDLTYRTDNNTLGVGRINVNSTANSTSTSTGALIIQGGVGIAGNLHVGGEIVVNSLTIQYTTITTTLVQTDDIIKTDNTTNASSTITGALQVAGGIGVGRDLFVGGLIAANRGMHEQFTTSTTATSVTNYDCATGQIFYHVTTGTQANWTANFTNLSLSNGKATSVSIVINQGTPPYYPSAVQIAGVGQTLNWQGNNTPTVNAFRTDVVTFSVLNNNGTYLVLGSSTGF